MGKEHCSVCKTVLLAEIEKVVSSGFDDFMGEYYRNTKTRIAKVTEKYSSKETIIDVWCPNCGIRYKVITEKIKEYNLVNTN